MASSWWDLLSAAFSGGLFVKFFDYIYQEYRRRSEAHQAATDLIELHIDPILKTADELVGKLRNLAQTDFKSLEELQLPEENSFEEWLPFLDILFLFAQFWARVQILRIEGIYINIREDKKGAWLLEFFRTLESTRIRVLPRIWQRGMGESLIEYAGGRCRSINSIDFVNKFLSQEDCRQWFYPLAEMLSRINHTAERQRILAYGLIVHAMIDHLDEDRSVTSDRPGWGNKLSNKTRKELEERIFKKYLTFVDAEKYFAKQRGGK